MPITTIPNTIGSDFRSRVNNNFSYADTKLSAFYNVKNYGATGDGTTDDSAAFQAAHDAATGGGTIWIPPGSYLINANINTSTDNIYWKGSGQGCTYLKIGSGCSKLFNTTNGSSTTQQVLPQFSDFSIDGNASTTGCGIYINGCRSVHIHHVYFVHCYRSVWVDTGSLTTSTFFMSQFFIEDTKDTSGAYGIFLDGGGDGWNLTDGHMFRNSQGLTCVGLGIKSGGGFVVTNTDIATQGKACTIAPAASHYVRFGQFQAFQCDTSYRDNLTIDESSAVGGGFPYGVYNLHFTNCWFSSAGANGSGADGNGVNCVAGRGIVFDACQMHSNSLHGIRIQSASHSVTVSHCQLSGNSSTHTTTYDGVHIDDSCDSVIVDGNFIGVVAYAAFTQRYGIYIGASSVNYIVANNFVANNVTDGIVDASGSTSGLVTNNKPDQKTFTYYVDPAGSDSADGLTPSTAWQTVSKVNGASLTAGQSVGFKRGGVWRERLIAPASGSSGSPITFGAYGSGPRPQFRGSTVVSSWSLDSGSVYKATSITWTPYMIFSDGVYVPAATSRVGMTAGTFFIDTTAHILYVWLADSSNPSGHTMEVCNNSDQYFGMIEDGPFSGKNYLVFEDLDVLYANWAGFRIFGGQHITIKNCSVTYAYNNAIVAIGTSQGAPTDPDDFTVIDTATTKTGYFRLTSGAAGAEAIALDGSNVFSILRNTVTTCYGEGIVAVNTAQSGTIADNLVVDQHMSGGIYLTTAGGRTLQDVTVTRNVIRDAADSAAIMGLLVAVEGTGTISNVDLTYNIVTNWTVASTYGIGLGNGQGTISGVRFLHNTVNNVTYGMLEQGSSTISGNTVENNIFKSTANPILITTGSSTSNTFNYNLYYPTGSVFYYLGSYYTFANFKTASSQEASGVNADPLFTSAATDDFTLQTGSPALSTGTYVTGVSKTDPPNMGAM